MEIGRVGSEFHIDLAVYYDEFFMIANSFVVYHTICKCYFLATVDIMASCS